MKLREPGAMPTPAIPATPLRVGDFAVLTPSTDALATQPVQLNHEMWPGLHEGDYVRVTVQRGEQRGASVDGYMFRWSHTLNTDKHNSQARLQCEEWCRLLLTECVGGLQQRDCNAVWLQSRRPSH